MSDTVGIQMLQPIKSLKKEKFHANNLEETTIDKTVTKVFLKFHICEQMDKWSTRKKSRSRKTILD